MKKIFEVKCGICGTKTGEYTLPASFQGDVEKLTNADIGIADSRCDSCEVTHGRFSEEAAVFMRDTGKSFSEFKVAAKREKGDVNKARKVAVDEHIEKVKEDQEKENLEKEAKK